MIEIGVIRTCFLEKFGIPRQSGLVPASFGHVELKKEFSSPEIIKGLSEFSHIWLIWKFHQNEGTWSHSVRPPRLGGNKKLGVFATRSPFRPNPIGISKVKLGDVVHENGKVRIEFSCHDILDGTPLLDLKPYINEVDGQIDSQDGWVQRLESEKKREVKFSSDIDDFFNNRKNLKSLIEQYLSLDPRPRYQESNGKEYANKLAGYDVVWESGENEILVKEIIPLN